LPRQQTLRALIDWSYNLLSEPERCLFRRLSVFVGGCSYEAIEGVCPGDGVDDLDVPDLLTRLVDRSLVVVERGEQERYRLLETLRQYGRDRLVEAGEAEGARERHRDWFLQLAEQAKPELIGPRQVFWLDRLEIERDNFRAALTWTVERGSPELGLRLAGALWPFWSARDFLGEGREWLARVLVAPGADAPTAARAEALAGACMLANSMGDDLLLLRLAEENLAICRTLGDRPGIACAVLSLARRAMNAGDHVRAEELGAEARVRAREAGAAWVTAEALSTPGEAALARGDYPLARERIDEGLRILRNLGDWRSVAGTLWSPGIAACHQGDYGAARAYFQEAVAISRELRSGHSLSLSLAFLGGLARLEGDFDQSRTVLEESLILARRTGNQIATGVALLNLGSLARTEGDTGHGETFVKESVVAYRDSGWTAATLTAIGFCGVLAIKRGVGQRGARLLGAVDPRYIRAWWVFPDDHRAYEESLVAARVSLGDAAFAAAWAAGQALTLEQAIAYALSGENPAG
jgi:tetratricopeptide (TPR) repeat protein